MATFCGLLPILRLNAIPMIFLVVLFLTLWFWRRNLKDASVWMIATYAGLGLMVWSDYQSASTLNDAFPEIIRDFLLIGMVGLVQSLAAARRIPVWLAIILTLGMFTFVHLWDKEGSPFVTEAAETEIALVANQPDPNGEFLVELTELNKRTAFEAIATANGWTSTLAFAPEDADNTLLDNYFVVDVKDVIAATAQLKTLAMVSYFEINEVVAAEPLISEESAIQRRQPGLRINDPETAQQWAMRVMKMEAYYQLLDQQKPTKTAKIAILDTGVDGRHEDIKENYFSVESKYDNDPVGHGTHCAGIAAGVTNNGIGIGSLAGSGNRNFVEVTSIKVLNASGMGTQKSIVAGIIEAADEGADVISLSLGGPSNQSRQRAYSQAVKYALKHGAIVVAAAGNSSRNAKDYSPANATGMITVAAIDEQLQKAVFSNTVEDVKWGIAAPGVAIYSTTPDNNYAVYSGTSMACPFVAGLLGTMRSVNPDLTAKQAYDILNATGRVGDEVKLTGRIVQPAAALKAALK